MEKANKYTIPANAVCNKCRRLYLENQSYMECDNSCNTCICACGNEFYFIYGVYHQGHDDKCGEDEDY